MVSERKSHYLMAVEPHSGIHNLELGILLLPEAPPSAPCRSPRF